MSRWGDAKLFFCILFITCCCTVTLAQIPMDCCLAVKNKTIEKALITDYRQQIAGQGCSLHATVLVTWKRRMLCVPADELWVQQVVKHVDWRKDFCKNKNHKARRCFTLKHQ